MPIQAVGTDEETHLMADPAPSESENTPTGHVTVSESQHNAEQAELRVLRKDKSDREAADTAAADKERQDKATAAGRFDEALGVEQGKTAVVQAELDVLRTKDVLRDAVASAGYTGEKAVALTDLVNPSDVSDAATAAAAVEGVTVRFPNMFKQGAAEADETPTVAPDPNGATVRRAAAPAQPVSDGIVPGGIITMEDYANTPQAIRLTAAFQARVDASKHTWPEKVVAAETFERG